jgi:hypothetical protein
MGSNTLLLDSLAALTLLFAHSVACTCANMTVDHQQNVEMSRTLPDRAHNAQDYHKAS